MHLNKGALIRLLDIVLVAAAYFAAGKIGLFDLLKSANVSIIWAPTGIAIGALVVFGYRVWPGVFAGAFLTSATYPDPLLVSLGIGAGNTLEAVLAAYFINRFAGGKEVFDHTNYIVKFTFLAAVIATAISSTVGAATLVLSGMASRDIFGTLWLTWWLGNAAGAFIVTPVFVLWANSGFRVDRKKLPEQLGVLTAFGIIFLVASGIVFQTEISRYPVVLLVVPIVIWCAFRLGPRDTATAIAVLAAIIVVRMVHGVGVIAGHSPRDELVPLFQIFMSSMSLMGLLIAAVVLERKRVAESLRWLATIVEFSSDAIVGKSLDGTIRSWNPAAERLYGYSAREAIGKPISILEPTDRLNEMPQLLERIRHGEVIERFETIRIRKDRARIDVSITLSPIKDEDGIIIGAASTAHSIFRWPAREKIEEEAQPA